MAESDGSSDSFSPRSSGSARSRLSLPSASRNGSDSQRRRRRLSGNLGRPPASERGDEEDGEEPGSSEGGGDERSRRMIRNQYRELICSVQQNREDMLSSKSNRLTEALEEANQLFSGVSCAREAALDAQFLVLASNLGKEKANELRSEITTFDSLTFAEDLLTFMGINRTETEGNDSDSESMSGGYLPSNAWYKLGEEAEKYFRRAPSFHYMLGSFKSEPPVPRQRIERQRKAPGGEGKRAMPAQLKKMEESHQEATAKEVERILRLLQTLFRNDLRDGLARIKLDDDKLPVIEPVQNVEERNDDHSTRARNQVVISLSHEEWREIVETYEITEPMISPPDSIEDEMETA
ncbi:non-structural maintenance of chromosomes element 4 homolog A isoform X2 [Phasianus colchicus]|uniref:non-structural maintenance of chromosomes element 4 homolog A isoform X2 n=1 Tax=Phasianus colchicus TaxID=9054 RepID=UPI00129DD599|nr:non-structural maintenance of chromosomes element 4 homolog A isoform X2 [Phasianus colchicus]